MKFTLKILFIASIYCTAAQAYIFEAEKWIVPNSDRTIILLGDYHPLRKRDSSIVYTQQDIVIDHAKKHKATILVEDGSVDPLDITCNPEKYDFNADHPDILTQPITTPIRGMTSRCHQEKIPVFNVEFRLHPSEVIASVASKRISTILAGIRAYNDGESLNSYYKQQLEILHEKVEVPCAHLFSTLRKSMDYCDTAYKSLEYDPAYDKTLDHFYLDKNNPSHMKIERILSDYQARLIDLRFIHAIAKRPNIPLILCAGSSHLQRIRPALKVQMGLVLKKRTANDMDYIKGPDPVDLSDVLADFSS